MKIKQWVLVTVIAAQTAGLRADETLDAIKQLKQQVEELQQKIKVLERNKEMEAGVADDKKKQTPTVIAGSEGFIIQSADTNFSFRIKGYGQLDARSFADGGPGKDTFTMRRLRLGLDGTVFQNYDFRILTDFGSGITSTSTNNAFLQDAYVNIHYWPQFQVQLGKFKEPVSMERLQTDANLLFPERGLPTQLSPDRDVGIQFQGDLLEKKLSYALGVFNGVADGGSGDIEVADEEKDLAARIFTNPLGDSEIDWLKGLGLGVGGSWGNQFGAVPSYSTPGRQKFFGYRSGDGTLANPDVTANGEHWRIAPQGYYYYGPFGLFGEYLFSSQEVQRAAGSTTSATLGNSAWNVALSYILTGEDNSWKPISPQRRFSVIDGGWGAWELAARIGQIDIDDGAFPLFATSTSAQNITSWGLGLNWHLNKNMKFNFDYEQSHFDGGSKKPGTVSAQDEQVFISRAQFQF